VVIPRRILSAPLFEARPGAEVLADRVEPLLHFGAHGPVAVAAIALLVDRGRLVAANALLPHAEETRRADLRLRLRLVVHGEYLLGPRGGAGILLLARLPLESGFDRGALGVVRLGGDLEFH